MLSFKEELINLYKEIPQNQQSEFDDYFFDSYTILENALINRCEEKPEDYASVYNKITQSVGSFFSNVSDSVSKSLCSAELLFTMVNARDDIDYSAISALYYQSVEALLNDVFWNSYVNFLRTLTDSDGASFVDIYSENRFISPALMGYLPCHYRNKYSSKDGLFDHLTLGTFPYLFEATYEKKELKRYYSYINKMLSISSKDQIEFNTAMKELYNLIKPNASERNTSSHGGTTIDYSTCCYHREMVISFDSDNGLINRIIKICNIN